MKKVIAIIIATVMFISFTACGSNTETESSKTSTEVSSEISDAKPDIQEKTPYEKVKDYLKTEGANYQGVYTIMHLGTTGYTISLYPDGYIYFYCNYEDKNNSDRETSASMKLYEDSVTQPVTFEYFQEGYKIEAEGTIYTDMFSDDFDTVLGVTYIEDFPNSVSTKQIEELVDALFGSQVKLMLAGVESMLIENVGVSLNDLGFTSW